MKLRNLFLIGLASAVLFAGCKKDEDFGPAEISISPADATHEFPIEGGEYLVELTATIDWALQGYDEEVQKWLSINPASGKASSSPQTVTIKAMNNGETDRTANIVFYGDVMHKASLTITQKGAKGDGTEGDGTLESPYNTAAAIKFIEEGAYSGNENISEKVYVKGTIVAIEEVSTNFGNATYTISNGEGTSELGVYRGYYLGGEKFTSEDQINVGDEVIVYGSLTKFYDEYQFAQNASQIYSLNGETASGGGDDEPSVDEPTSATPIDISEFLEKQVNTTDWYELTGEIVSIAGAEYGNFTMKDETGSVYVYGLVKDWANGKNDKSFSQIGLEVGDVVTIWTLRAEHSGSPQAGGNIPAIYQSHKDGAPVTYPEGSVFLTFPDGNQKSVNNYTSTWQAVIGEYTFTLVNFNNSQNNWKYVKCGRKADPSVASISNNSAMPKLSSIEVTADVLKTDVVNSITLNIYSDAGQETLVAENIEANGALSAGILTFEIPAEYQNANQYYKLTFDCAVAGDKNGNGSVQISKVTYIAAE